MKHIYLLYTGFGKTKLCLDAIMNSPVRPHALLLSTKNIIEMSWQAEITKWYPGQLTYQGVTGTMTEQERLDAIESQPDILGINVEMLQWYIAHTVSVKRKTIDRDNNVRYTYDTDEILKRFDLLIIDEVSLFKNSQSQRFKDVKKWAYKMDNVMLLSATPTPKNIENLWSLTYFIDGGQRLGKSITEFRRRYAIPVALPTGFNRYDYTTEAIDEVLIQIKDIVTSIPVPAQPLFPEPIYKRILIKPDDATTKMLQDFKRDYVVELTNGKHLAVFSRMKMITKMLQMANGNVFYNDQVVSLNRFKMSVLKARLQTITTPVLIPYVYTFDRDELLKLPGARLLAKRKDFEDWNNNLIPIGVISPFSAAHGLNLQDSACEHIIWFSPIWDTEKWIQLNARVCRRGQTKVVNIWILLLKESLDEYAFERCQDKFAIQLNNLNKLR